MLYLLCCIFYLLCFIFYVVSSIFYLLCFIFYVLSSVFYVLFKETLKKLHILWKNKRDLFPVKKRPMSCQKENELCIRQKEKELYIRPKEPDILSKRALHFLQKNPASDQCGRVHDFAKRGKWWE